MLRFNFCAILLLYCLCEPVICSFYGHFFTSKMVAIVVGFAKNFRCPKVRRPSNDEKAEDTRIRERLRNLPAWKKDFSERKQRGPMVCIHFCF